MSYGIIRVQKFKASDVRGIQSHDLRERDSHTNPDIDKERSDQNYALVESPDFKASIQERLNTLKSTKAVRKDAVVMCQFLVTSDHVFFQDLTPDKQKAFFENALQFIGGRYGKENILSATVHMDEKTPHMHVNMTPIRDGRLTAKEIFSRPELADLHTAFHTSVGQAWGLERGQSREEKRRHLDTEAFKLESKRAELEKQGMKLFMTHAVQHIYADDLTPRQLGSKMLGLVKEQESPEMIAVRLNEQYVRPLKERLGQLPALQQKVEKLEAAQKKAKPELEILRRYRQAFRDGLTDEQQKTLRRHANEFRAENYPAGKKRASGGRRTRKTGKS